MSTTLPFYWNLSSADKEERVDASVKLVSSVLEFQAQFAAAATPASPPEQTSSDESENEDEKESNNEIDELNAEDVRYAIRRLVRGLASPRESSRLGFAVALTELLSRLSTVSAEQVIALVLSSSQTQGSMQGHEIRDQYFARLFGFVSVIQSGLLFRESTLPTSGSSRTLAATLVDFQTVVNELLSLGEKKSWLKESCWWALSLALTALGTSSASWKNEALTWLSQTIYADNQAWSSEKVAITVTFQRISPSLAWKKLLAPTFKDEHILSSRNIPIVARLLREAPLEESNTEGSSSKTGHWKPQLHYAWTTIFHAYFPLDGSSASTHSTFQEFYRAAVDESLFSNTSSPERKSWGFSVFQLALSTIPPTEIPLLFTQNFMRTWINQLAGSDRSLHKTARQVATSVQAAASRHPAIGFTLVLQLVGRHGSRQFDKITKTKTVENLIASADVEGVKGYIEFLRSQIIGDASSSDTAAAESQRIWAMDQLAALVKNSSVPRDDEWIMSVLEILAVLGFFEVSKKSSKSKLKTLHALPSPPFSPASKLACRQRFFTCLSDLTNQSTAVTRNEKVSKQPGVNSQGDLWIVKAVELMEELESETNVRSLANKGEELRELLVAAAALPCSQRFDEKDDIRAGCQALIQSLMLQSYDPEANVHDLLQTCVDSVRRILPPAPALKKNKKSSKPAPVAEDKMDVDENDVPPIDEIVDILIGFLETSTAFSRSVATFVFNHLTSEVRSSTIDFILKQLDDKNLDDDHSSHEEDEDDEGTEEADDIGMDDAEATDNSEVDDDSDSNSEDDDSNTAEDDDEEEEFDIEADDELRQKIAAALNMKDDADEDDEEENMMDDEQMLKMDEQLAQVFRMQQGPKSDKKRADDVKREATHFKNRVLDFLDLFIKNQPTSPLIPTLIMPLIESVRSARSDETHFSEKATNLLNGRIANLKQMPDSFTASDEIVQQLHEIHNLARKAPSSAFESTLNAASLYLSRVIAHAGRAGDVSAAYRQSLVDFITRKGSRLNLSFFQTWVKKLPAVAWLAKDEIISVCGSKNAVNDFRRMQAFQLLQDFMTHLATVIDSLPSPDVLKFASSCQQLFNVVLTKAARAPENEGLTANQVKQVIRGALQAVRLTKRFALTPDAVQSVWNPDTVSELVITFQESSKFKTSSAVLSMLNQLLGVISNAPKADRKSSKKEKKNVVKEAEPASQSMAINGPSKEEKIKKKVKRKAEERLDGSIDDAPVVKKKKKVKIDT